MGGEFVAGIAEESMTLSVSAYLSANRFIPPGEWASEGSGVLHCETTSKLLEC
jgi:hypothetical protein